MEAMKADVTQGLKKGSVLTCADNTGARELKVLSTSGYSGRLNRQPKRPGGRFIDIMKVGDRPPIERHFDQQRRPRWHR